MRSSRFVNLSSYCIVEYMFDQLNSLDIYNDSFILLQNNYLDIHQIFNDDSSYSSTRNIKDLTVTPIGGNVYAYLDSEKIPDYLSYDSQQITQTPINGYNVVMDKVRFHFVAGFDLDGFKALILSVRNTENDGKNNLFANILVSPETSAELIIYNPKPLFLSNAVYDRYIDVLVPSIKNVNQDYLTAPVQSTTFAAAITPKGAGFTGFIQNSPIYVGLAECGKRKTIFTNTAQTYDGFEVTEFYEAPLSQSNEFDNVGAYINQAVDGDFIEFYLTFNAGFPSDLISILNARNPSDDWIIIHQISVFEQVGSGFINSSRFVFFQEDRFDEPNVFRPVLRNANEAVSMSIDYLARLTNRRNGEQIIREASYSLISPKKYGKKLITLPLLDKPQSQKIYNKLIKKNFEATKLFIEPKLNSATTSSEGSSEETITTVVRTEYVPIFFNSSNISVSISSSLIKTSDSLEEVVFSQGKLRFIITPFDNVLKFKVYTLSNSSDKTSQIPLDLNINSARYRLVFETTSGKITIDNLNDSKIESLSSGIIAFNVSKKNSETILQSNKKSMYLVALGQDGTETLIYSGEWRTSSEQAEVDAAIATVKSEAASAVQIQTTLDQIKTSSQTVKPSEVNIEKPIKGKAVAPTVNRFGVTAPQAIIPNSTNAGKNQ